MTKDQVRLDAINSKSKKYIGSKCKYGHSGIRYSSTGQCVDCATKDRRKVKNGLLQQNTETGNNG